MVKITRNPDPAGRPWLSYHHNTLLQNVSFPEAGPFLLVRDLLTGLDGLVNLGTGKFVSSTGGMYVPFPGSVTLEN